jgi:hypothetical protein
MLKLEKCTETSKCPSLERKHGCTAYEVGSSAQFSGTRLGKPQEICPLRNRHATLTPNRQASSPAIFLLHVSKSSVRFVRRHSICSDTSLDTVHVKNESPLLQTTSTCVCLQPFNLGAIPTAFDAFGTSAPCPAIQQLPTPHTSQRHHFCPLPSRSSCRERSLISLPYQCYKLALKYDEAGAAIEDKS